MSKQFIGDWQATRDVITRMGVSVFTIPKGAVVAIKRFDDANNMVLVEAGPRDIDWKHKSFLDSFTPLF